MRILGIDWGDKKMGVAISDPMNIIARGVGVFYGEEKEKIEKLREMVDRFNVELIVLGFPLSLSGEVGKQAEKILKVKEKIETTLKIKVELVDERFTTKIANTPIKKSKEKRKKGRKKVLDDDTSSAIIILNSYLERLR
ncbi:MAG: Holliday junction resolvase RuvX [Caldiserica bacterium]|nr:MAG: Holliday junction resolvase RuvX [Caldisericota bacterium]